MPDFISENIEKYKEITEVYKATVTDTLEAPLTKLKSVFAQLLNEKAQDYSLQKVNSVYKSKYYSIKGRIKEETSFYEKLIRKNIGLSIVAGHNLINEDVNTKKAGIISDIQKLDDIIGVRIVTELKKDCIQVYKLLENSKDFFIRNEISFQDLEDQPQRMKNGLDIYRIKGIFQGLYGFELQIKSKIDEAWGDLDHTLFYKDYSVTPIKDTVQVTMNNVGELLDRIEHLLYDLRESGANYVENSEHIKFQEKIENELSVLLKEKFDAPYQLKEISHFLKHFHELISPEVLITLDYDHLRWPVQTPLVDSYLKIRDSNFHLIVIETIYINWWNSRDGVDKIIEDNYDNQIQQYLFDFSRYYAEILSEDSDDFFEGIKNLMNHSSSSEILLSAARHKEFQEISARIMSMAAEDEDIDNNHREIIKMIQILIFNGDVTPFLDQALDANVGDGLIKIKDIVKNKKNNLDKKIFLLATELLESLRNI
ncbi:nucleotidyltransferase family protein [Dyadobacter aurulentus]|uniref:hypothetical protein n=1 Tax=Dyadobacter sp. UC 10 TaxID=2605428 RepID=UPI0011F10FDF|nr:hypothetical protein [Dyadobacter sp. UC 10]KAA0990409.1 hypothetical protein FXO21_09690 [Dyadobacter sp. UC 10]